MKFIGPPPPAFVPRVALALLMLALPASRPGWAPRARRRGCWSSTWRSGSCCCTGTRASERTLSASSASDARLTDDRDASGRPTGVGVALPTSLQSVRFGANDDVMTHTITLIPGDGIGPEVTEAVVRILKASGVSIDWEHARRRRARVRAHRAGAAGRADRLDPPEQGRAQGTGDDADRPGLHERERRAAQGARSLREPAAGVEPAGRATRGFRASTW